MATTLPAILQSIRPEANFAGAEDFVGEGLLDSFDIVMLVSALDKTFGISIEGTDILPENFKDLRTITALLGKYGVRL